jgi:hypothetical protein
MLSPSEVEFLRKSGYCFLHDTRLNSILDGEPFVRDGFVVYYDGRRMMLCGYPLHRDGVDARERLREVVRQCLSNWVVEILWHVGPERLSLQNVRPRLPVLRTWKPTKRDTEMVIDCHQDPPSQRLCRWLRSPKRTPFRIGTIPAGELRSAHYEMIDTFFRSKVATPFLFNLACQVMLLTTAPCGLWLEVCDGDRLAGLAALVESFDSMCLAVFQATNPDFPTAGDTLHAAMRELVLSKGKRYLNLGSSPGEGHYRFKKKWGGVPHHSPAWWQAWGSGELTRSENDSWPSRLLTARVRRSSSNAQVHRRGS